MKITIDRIFYRFHTPCKGAGLLLHLILKHSLESTSLILHFVFTHFLDACGGNIYRFQAASKIFKVFLLKDDLLSQSLFRLLNLGMTVTYFWKVSKVVQIETGSLLAEL